MAFDHDAKRFKTLRSMVRKAGAKCITVQLADFLQVMDNKLYNLCCYNEVTVEAD